jgi:uncharacterized protein Yka (UPF0111/DUF47 family)
MKKSLLNLFTFALFTICLTTAMSVQAQIRPYRGSDSNVQFLLNRIETRTDNYKRALNTALDVSKLNNTDTEDRIMDYITAFENATDVLKRKFDARESVAADVTDVLNRAAYIEQFMKENRLTALVQRNWTYIRTDLSTLARYYGVTFDLRAAPINTTTTIPYRVPDSTVSALLSRIETETDAYKRSLDRSLDRSAINNTNREDNINEFVTAFENATDSLKQKFDARESVAADVQEVLVRASFIDRFMRNNRLNALTQRNWGYLRTDLSRLAGYYNVAFNLENIPVNNSNTAYRAADRDVQGLLTRLEQRTDSYKREMNNALDRSALNNTRSEQTIFAYITDFENATDRLKQKFDARTSTSADVEEVLSRANFLDNVMRDYRFTAGAENDWRLIRTDLSTLSRYYSVTTNYDRPFTPASRFDEMITGTYRLNVGQSDNVREVVGRATNIYTPNQRDNITRNLERRLSPPETLAIEKRNNQVTIASNMAQQITFDADGVARTETTPNGRTIKVTAKTYYDGVALEYEGDRINDFYVNFVPMSNGQLRVVRRVYLENRNETVTVASVYDKINDTAQFSNLNNNNTGVQNSDFVIPNNTQLMAQLRSTISTKASQNGDRFTMEVISPSQYSGAIIEGRVAKAERSGQVSGRANVSLEFDTIRLRNGQTYRFAGIVDNVKPANGENITVTNEGTVRDNNQTTKTVTRAGIGAALGALIGAIAGGGQGAAIGAAIGAGAGAGTVILQGRDDVELAPGTEFMITATAPANVNR